MNSNSINKTKCKIIECAKGLFCKKGIDGTSIRDIAKGADVNLAAINYHFKSKENLYTEIFKKEYTDLSNLIEDLFHKSSNLVDLSLKTHELLLKNSTSLIFIFHSFLNLDLNPIIFYNKDIKEIGPIGTDIFLKQLEVDLKHKTNNIDKEKKMWLIHNLLTIIIHNVIASQSPLLKKISNKVSFLNKSKQKESIKHTAQALYNYLSP